MDIKSLLYTGNVIQTNLKHFPQWISYSVQHTNNCLYIIYNGALLFSVSDTMYEEKLIFL